MKARWERGLRLEASERLYVMHSGQQSVLDAAQRRLSGAVADASSEYGQIWPKAAKVGGLMKGWERGLRLEASERLYVMCSGQQSVLMQPREDGQALWLMQVVSMARFGQKRGLRLEASERLYVMCSGQQSVLDAAQRRLSGALADASSEYGQIWPKAAKVGA
jgi:hypothetical protein